MYSRYWWLGRVSTTAHVWLTKDTQERCPASTYSIHDWFSSAPTCQISLCFSRTRSISYFCNCIRDSFTFANAITTSKLNPSSVFLCFFDISSLFTEVPLAESIQICAVDLYNLEHPPAPFPRETLIELMEMVTSSVEFTFNNIMHR